MKKSKLNQNIKISDGNIKLQENDKDAFIIFNLIATKTCPYATNECKKICHERFSQEINKKVMTARVNNFEESKKETFVKDMIDCIEYQLNRKKYNNKHIYFRIHSAGDFYSKEYFNKWIEITKYFKDNDRIDFQAYTKSLPFLEGEDLKDINIKLVFSVMVDTPEEQTKKAKDMELQCFIPVRNAEDKEGFKCSGKCLKCKACYTQNNIKDIYISYHGSRNVKSNIKVKKEKKYYKNITGDWNKEKAN